ncbi:GtrA family protein [Salinarchaeum laminariae]|uniref:GtrA family protein n=1 Tax=Salinarchaeum laminariae TaxID=869888 RepID=UPI0020C14F47|nr:GtrA family protein [Salinarchaeum laminariae]
MVELSSALRETLKFNRLWQFMAVGAVGTACDFAVLIGLVELFSTSPVVAKIVSAETAIVVMFVINERWTFASWGANDLVAVFRRLLTSNVVRLGGLAVATVVLAVLTVQYDVSYVLANGAGIATGFIVNYTMENLFTWRTHR